MPHLIFVRHSITKQQPEVSSHDWTLTPEGEARCAILAEKLKPYAPAVIVTSEEPKARLTGAITARHLGLPTETEHGLHEHLRHNEPYTSAEEFLANIRALLTRPDEQLFGEESGTVARQRFEQAVQNILARHPGQTVAAVTHGTVLSLFLAHRAQLDPVAYWQSIGMPAYIVLSLPDYRVVERVDAVVEA